MKADYPSALLAYAGKTIGMIENPETGTLENFNFGHLLKHVPELERFDCRVSSYQFDPPIDSSDMEPAFWIKLVKVTNYSYDSFGGFAILHGTDTVAYTASALNFMLENLGKPITLTDSQLPIGILRTNDKGNLITAIETAVAKSPGDTATVPEICILSESHLMCDSRTIKINAESLNAFRSFNYLPLVRTGIHIKYEPNLTRKPNLTKPLKPHYLFDMSVVILTPFSGVQEGIVSALLHAPELKAVVLKTFGSGNAPQKGWFVRELKDVTGRGTIIVNTTRCASGAVGMRRCGTDIQLLQAGVISGHDSILECTVTRLMSLLGHGLDNKEIRYKTNFCLIDEITKRTK